jgi:hypothetical protein
MVDKPQGRKPRSRTEATAGPVGYGDLNGGSGPGELDSASSNSTIPAKRRVASAGEAAPTIEFEEYPVFDASAR